MKKLFLLALFYCQLSFSQTGIIGWGDNNSNQTVPIVTQEKIIDFDAGVWSSCAVLESGKIICHGCADPLKNFGQCDSSQAPIDWDYSLRMLRPSNKNMKNITTSFGSTCGINIDGEVECWGCAKPRQNFQCLVPDEVKKQKALIAKEPINGTRTIDASETSTCVILENGQVSCWGCEESDNVGQCDIPKNIKGKGLTTSMSHTCIILENGKVQCFGSNEQHQLDVPPNIDKIKRVVSGEGFSAAVSENGELFIWGESFTNLCHEKNNECKDVNSITASNDYLCIKYINGKNSCYRSENKKNYATRDDVKERNQYSWIKDEDIISLSVDSGITTALVESNILYKYKDNLPTENKSIDMLGYLKNRPILQQSINDKKSQYNFKNYIGMRFVTIPSGEFLMGSCQNNCEEIGYSKDPYALNNEKPLHKVSFSYEFQIGIFEVTIGEFKKYIKSNNLNMKEFLKNNFYPDYYPVNMVSWFDAKNFVNWLNKNKPKNDNGTYRLPTESEWEYVARAGTKSIYWTGDNAIGKNQINCKDCLVSHTPGTIPVGSLPPNAFGVYEVLGNVDEWVEDCINESGYTNVPVDGKPYVDLECKNRVARGGSWEYSAETTRSSWRDFYPPSDKTVEQGFRVVRELK